MGFWDSVGRIVGGGAGAEITNQITPSGMLMDIATGGSYSNSRAAAQINQQNIEYAREYRDWSQMMSNSAYQRATKDMRAAGLNPMLAYSQGGAGTPNASPPTLQNPEPGNIGAGLLNSAKTALSMGAEIKNKNADTNLKTENVENTAQDTELKAQQQQESRARTTQSEQAATKTEIEGTNALTEREILKHRAKAAKAEAETAERENELGKARYKWDLNLQKFDAGSERLEKAVNAIPWPWRIRIGGGSNSSSKTFPSNPNPPTSKPPYDWKANHERIFGK